MEVPERGKMAAVVAGVGGIFVVGRVVLDDRRRRRHFESVVELFERAERVVSAATAVVFPGRPIKISVFLL